MVETEKKQPITVDKAFEYLCKAINKHGQEAHIKIAAYLGEATNDKFKNIGVYKASTDVSDDDKRAMFKHLYTAFCKGNKPDYSQLKKKDEAMVKPRAVKPSKNLQPVEVEVESEVTPEITADTSADPITRLIIELVRKHIKVTGIDEDKVEEVARRIVNEFESDYDSKFHDKVAKAMNNGAFPVERVEKMMEELERDLLNSMVKRIELITPDGSVRTLDGIQHETFPVLVQMAQARRVNILLVGPTGSGKTTGAEQLAQALDLEFYFNGAIDTEYKLKGFLDAQGRLISPAFRKAFEKGGVYLFDEVDASLPAAVLAFNAALSNHYCDFPDGKVERHKDCIIIAAGNTWMGGGTFEYVGRMKQDAAFADRFATLSWPIDEKMEMAACSNKEWCSYVQEARANAVRHGLKVIISPRATFFGEQLLACKVPREQVILSVIKKGMTDDQWKTAKPSKD